MKKKIIITGGSGRFGSVLKKSKNKFIMFFPNRKELNILSLNSIKNYLKKIKPQILIHAAGLSRPMSIHEERISQSIDLNIIGTANIVKACSEFNIKLIYFSTHYVYPCKQGEYSENSPLLPINNYAWSKLGGECSVQMYKNSLIVRACMSEKPFAHKEAFINVKSNFIYHEDVSGILFRIINEKGIINIGGKKQSIYNFARKDSMGIKKKILKKNINFPRNPVINISKLKKKLKKNLSDA